MIFQIQDQKEDILLVLTVNREIKSKDISNRFTLVSIKSFSTNRLYKGLDFEIKKFYNINSIDYINKYKVICSRINKNNQEYRKSILYYYIR